jgi:hypothetical protein
MRPSAGIQLGFDAYADAFPPTGPDFAADTGTRHGGDGSYSVLAKRGTGLS